MPEVFFLKDMKFPEAEQGLTNIMDNNLNST